MIQPPTAADSRRDWGIRSLAAGSAYPWARSRADVAFMLAGTGAPERYEMVRMAICLTDPISGVPIPPLTVSAAELRRQAEAWLGRRSRQPGRLIRRWLQRRGTA